MREAHSNLLDSKNMLVGGCTYRDTQLVHNIDCTGLEFVHVCTHPAHRCYSLTEQGVKHGWVHASEAVFPYCETCQYFTGDENEASYILKEGRFVPLSPIV